MTLGVSTGLVVRAAAATVGLGALLAATPWALRVEGNCEDPMLEFSLTQTGTRATHYPPAEPERFLSKINDIQATGVGDSVFLFQHGLSATPYLMLPPRSTRPRPGRACVCAAIPPSPF